jgi:hypothetical protein
MTTPPWSSRLADAVRAELARAGWTPTVHAIRPVTDDVLEVVFSGSRDGNDLRGIRLDRRALDAATGRLQGHTLEETAFDVVYLGISEPRNMAAFDAPDASGVRWLPLADWIADIS